MGEAAGVLCDAVPVHADVSPSATEGGMMRELFGQDAVDLLRAQVAKKGHDYVYVRRNDAGVQLTMGLDIVTGQNGVCMNWVRGPEGTREPDCLLGHVYADLGVLNVVFQSATVWALRRTLWAAGVRMTPRALYLFDVAQVAQDAGRTWGEALRYAGRAMISCSDDDTMPCTDAPHHPPENLPAEDDDDGLLSPPWSNM